MIIVKIIDFYHFLTQNPKNMPKNTPKIQEKTPKMTQEAMRIELETQSFSTNFLFS